MYCTKCGKEISNLTVSCPACGAPTPTRVSESKWDWGPLWPWAILCFLQPLIGLVLFILWRKEDPQPRHAKTCGIAALTNVLVNVVAVLLTVVIILTVTVPGYYADERKKISYEDLFSDSYSLFGMADFSNEGRDDGIAFQYLDFFNGKDLTYDATTDTVIVKMDRKGSITPKGNRLSFYDRMTGESVREPLDDFDEYAVSNGKLVYTQVHVAGENYVWAVYTLDLADPASEPRELFSTVAVHRAVISGIAATSERFYYVIGTGEYMENDVYSCTYEGERKLLFGINGFTGVFYASETLNRLIVGERRSNHYDNGYFSTFRFYDLNGVFYNETIIENSTGYPPSYYFDGNYLYYFYTRFDKAEVMACYDGLTGKRVSNNALPEYHPGSWTFAKATIWTGERYALIQATNCELILYDRTTKKVVTRFEKLYATKAWQKDESTLVIGCGVRGYIATIDLSRYAK